MSLSRRTWIARSAGVACASALGVGLFAGITSAAAAQEAQRRVRPAPGGEGGGLTPGAGVRAIDLDWTDPRRNRAVPAKLYLPADTSAAKVLPLVVFSHGIGGSRQGYRYLGSHLAAEGWMSLHVQHVGSDRQLWTAGNPFALLSRLRGAAQETEAIARVEDVRYALDELLRSEWGGRVDASRIVAAGHSYGANTSLLLAGAQVEREGTPLDLRDRRVGAAILISAPPFYGEGSPERILSPVQVPTLHITSTDDVILIPGYNSGLPDRLSVFENVGGHPKVLTVFEGGSHSVFTDRTRTGGAEANQRIKAATQELTVTFLRGLHGGGGLGPLSGWQQRHGDILSSFVLRA